ncbi:MAG: geranylgeranylglycerol-phosphate geranylgeranyltransferase [Bacteroidetes bacterium]|nr:geranylgeranylglycerol-phosphate geranylgeranyltransferase [Bacteroidota bacterium]
MKKIQPALKMIRWQNLAIIILLQYLLRYGILNAFLFHDHPGMISGLVDFSLMVTATVLLTVGGYLINDYFDTRIDSVNKPKGNPVGTAINGRAVILAHIIVNLLAALIGFYLAYHLHTLSFGLIFPFISMLLWLYSARYKRTLAWGNLVVAILSAMVVFIVWYFEFLHLKLTPMDFSQVLPELRETTWYFIAYGLFAFLVSFFREIIKDMEDIAGDKEFGCRTLPIVIGTGRSKYVVTFLVILTILFLGFWQWTFINRGWTLVFWYFLIVIQIPLLYLLILLFRAKKREEYHFLSNLCKLIMFAGILSMQLISSGI